MMSNCRPYSWIATQLLGHLVLTVGCPASPDTELSRWCEHEGAAMCSCYDPARDSLSQERHSDTDPYDATAGHCGAFRYLQHREERVPSDQQESIRVTRFYDAEGILVGARVGRNGDSSGAYSDLREYGVRPDCRLASDKVLNRSQSWRKGQ